MMGLRSWVGRWLRNDTLNRAFPTALLPPLLLAMVAVLAGFLGPCWLQRYSARTDALKKRGELELRAFEELHSLASEFYRVRLAYDARATHCRQLTPPDGECMAEPLRNLGAFAVRWDDRIAFNGAIISSYLGHPEDGPVLTHFNGVRDVVDRTIDCLYPRGDRTLNLTTCRLEQLDIDQLESDLFCFSRFLLESARQHAEGSGSRAEDQRCP